MVASSSLQKTKANPKSMKNRLLVTVVEAGRILERCSFEVTFRRNLDSVTVVFKGDPSPFGCSGKSRKNRIFIDPNATAYQFSIIFTHSFANRRKVHTSQVHYAWVLHDPEHLPEGWYEHA